MVDQVSPPSVLPYTPFGRAKSTRESAINANAASWLEGVKATAMRLMPAAGRPVVSLVRVGVAALTLSVRYTPLPPERTPGAVRVGRIVGDVGARDHARRERRKAARHRRPRTPSAASLTGPTVSQAMCNATKESDHDQHAHCDVKQF